MTREVLGFLPTDVSVQAQIALGREVLYGGLGLYPTVTQLINVLETNTTLPHREAFIELPDVATRFELYATKSAGGIAIKRILGTLAVNIETDTLNVPHNHFVSLEHILKRSSSRGKGERIVPPMVKLAGDSFVDEGDASMGYFLKNYLGIAESMRKQLIAVLTEKGE